MKWTTELDSKLEELFKTKNIYEVSDILGLSKSSIQNRASRLKIDTGQYKHEKINCLNCSKELVSRKSEKRKFCSSACAAIYNNTGNIKSSETKSKQRQSLHNTLLNKKGYIRKEYQYDKNNKRKSNYIKKDRACKSCSSKIEGLKQYCEKCREYYYNVYRFDCNFKFSIKDYEFIFSKEELELLKALGMYSASNRGNNISGVSRDHLFSVREGFKLVVPSFIISHPANCQLLKHSDNNKKNTTCEITLNELHKRIIEAEKIKRYLTDEELEIVKGKLAELVR